MDPLSRPLDPGPTDADRASPSVDQDVEEPWKLVVALPDLVGSQGAQTILNSIEPHHTELVLQLELYKLRPEGIRSLLDGLRDLSRRGQGQPDGFRLESISLCVVQIDRYEQLQDRQESFRVESAWCLPLVIDAFFANPADFPHLTSFALAGYWSSERVEDIRTMVLDARLHHLYLKQSVAPCSVLIHLLQAVLDRIPRHPHTLDQIGLPSLDWIIESDDPALNTVRDLLLDVLRTGRDGVLKLKTDDWRIMDGVDGERWRPALMDVLRANTSLEDLQLPSQEGDDPFYRDIIRRYDWNEEQSDVVGRVAQELVAPALVLLSIHRYGTSQPGTLSSLPAEITDIILHELAGLIAEDVASFVFRGSGWNEVEDIADWERREAIDGRLNRRQVRNVLKYASEVVQGTRKVDWRGRWFETFLVEVDCRRWEGT